MHGTILLSCDSSSENACVAYSLETMANFIFGRNESPFTVRSHCNLCGILATIISWRPKHSVLLFHSMEFELYTKIQHAAHVSPHKMYKIHRIIQ